MPYIIDGNNLIGCSPDISLEDKEARTKLLHIVRNFQENRNNNVILFFDGEPANGLYREEVNQKFSIRYPRFGGSADEEIRELLESYSDYRDVILVSSDRELKTIGKKKGAKIVNSIEFYFRLKQAYRVDERREEKKKRIDAQLSDNEVDQWMKIFQEG